MRAMSEPTPGRSGRVHQVNVSRGGVPKLPVERARVHHLGLDGDGHDEPEPIHGGPDQAVSLYCAEAIARVAADGHTAYPGAYGENLTLEGIDWATLAAGDRLAIGDGGLELELTKPCSPCTTLGHYFADGRFARISPKVHLEDSRWYARVLREGPVAPGDRVEVTPGDRVAMPPAGASSP
jgi:MOSC domain-containing protein YiiM